VSEVSEVSRVGALKRRWTGGSPYSAEQRQNIGGERRKITSSERRQLIRAA
jgi:hypothetical protein